MAEDKASIFRGSKTVSNVIPSSSNTAENDKASIFRGSKTVLNVIPSSSNMADDKASIFRGSKTVTNVIPSSSNMANNQQQTKVCMRFFNLGFKVHISERPGAGFCSFFFSRLLIFFQLSILID